MQWQTDMVASCWKMSAVSTGAERQGYFQRGLAILQQLAKEDKLNADQKTWIPAFQDALAKP